MNKQAKYNMKLFLIFSLIVLSTIGLVYALTSVILESPAGGSWDTDGIVEFNYTLTAINNSYLCNFSETWTYDNNGTWNLNMTDLAADNSTLYNVTIPSIADGNWQWKVGCWNATEGYNVESTPNVIKIDTTTPTVLMDSPRNTTNGGFTYWPNATIQIRATCTDTNPHQMYLDINDALNETRLYSNASEENWFWQAPGDGTYIANIRCDDDAGNIGSNETNTTFIVDATASAITINSPISPYYSTDGNMTVNYTFTETNADTCELWINQTENNSIDFTDIAQLNQTDTSPTAGEEFSPINLSTTTTTTVGYYWAVRCNDTLNNFVYTNNYTFLIDLDDPSQVGLISPYNATVSSDYLPNLTWYAISDLYFDKYIIYVDNDTDFSSPNSYEISSNETTTYEITTSLAADTQYYWKINVTALSGRGSATNDTYNYYKTDSICHTLEVGYNFCGIVRDENSVWDNSYSYVGERENATGISLNQIQLETDADYVYYYNASHDWITYQNGTSTDKYYNITTGETIVIYTDTESIWPIAGGAYAGRVWSTNQTVSSPSWDINITNFTDGYNLYSIRQQEGRTLYNLSQSFEYQGWADNASIYYETYVNNSGIGETCYGARDCGQFVPFRYNWTINNDTLMRYGESVWLYFYNGTYEGDSVYWNVSCGYAGEC